MEYNVKINFHTTLSFYIKNLIHWNNRINNTVGTMNPGNFQI